MNECTHPEQASIEALRALVAELQGQCADLCSERDALADQTRRLQYEKDRLRVRVEKLAYLLYGRRSEKLTPSELKQLALSFGVSENDAAAAEPSVPHGATPTEEGAGEGSDAEKCDCKTKRRRRKHPGRSKLSPEIERVVTRVLVPDAERSCQCCAAEMRPFKFIEHERVEHVPEKLVVYVEQREVLGCTRCRGDVATASRQAPAHTRRAGNSLLATLIENKCDDALPIHRQRDRLRRLGFDVPVNTLYEYFAYGTDLIAPVAGATLSTIFGRPYVQADDTTIKVLDKRHPKGRFTGRFWCFGDPAEPLIGFAFTNSWSAEAVAPLLGAIEGFIHCDDYKGYSKELYEADGTKHILVPPERRLGCMMHVRRRFYEAFRLGFEEAGEPILYIREIYAIEAVAKQDGLDANDRLALRLDKSVPYLDRFDAWVDAHVSSFAPRSKMGDAVRYSRNQRPFVRRCFSDGRFEIDTGHVERAIRKPAIGRRNYLFTGSRKAAERLANGYTLVLSCRQLGISARDYLIDILDKIESGWPLRRLSELVPTHWAQERGLWTPR